MRTVITRLRIFYAFMENLRVQKIQNMKNPNPTKTKTFQKVSYKIFLWLALPFLETA